MDSLVLVICTKDRPQIISAQLGWLESMEDLPSRIYIIDSSDKNDTHKIIKAMSSLASRITYIRSSPGLPHQRNVAINRLRNLASDHPLPKIVCFLDDDILPSKGYFANVLKMFALAPGASCIGGFDRDLVAYSPSRLAVLLGILPLNSGFVSRSAFTHVPIPYSELTPAQWIPGGMQNFRFEVLKRCLFDGRYRMYGEDLEMHLRTVVHGPIFVSSMLPVVHLKNQEGKDKRVIQLSYYSGLRWWLSRKYPKRFPAHMVALGSLALLAQSLAKIYSSPKNFILTLAAELIALKRLVLNQPLRPLVKHSGSGPEG